MKNLLLKGNCAARGVALGRAVRLPELPGLFASRTLDSSEIEPELERFNRALDRSRQQLKALLERLADDLEHRSIFDAHLLLLKDPMLVDETATLIREQRKNCEWALVLVMENIRTHMVRLENHHFHERLADLEDIGNRILTNLGDINARHGDIRFSFLEKLTSDDILIADSLSPSLVLHLNQIGGVVTEKGGVTGHTAILARNRGFPLLVGVQGVLSLVQDGDQLLINSGENYLIVEPELDGARRLIQLNSSSVTEAQEISSQLTLANGENVNLWANIDEPEEVSDHHIQNSHGIGLFRTEFIYLRNPELFVNESEQSELYARVIEQLRERPIIFRLLDVGGDKQFENSFFKSFGYDGVEIDRLRGMQFLLYFRSLMISQLKAIFRAIINLEVEHNNCRLMLPMVSTIGEIVEFKAILNEVRRELVNEYPNGTTIPDLPIGIMLETPAACLMADAFSNHVEFFSIGTNDLSTYTMARERSVDDNGDLLLFQPAVLRLIKTACQLSTVPIALCGEMATVTELLYLLLGMGIRNFSVGRHSLSSFSANLKAIDPDDTRQLLKRALNSSDSDELKELLTAYHNEAIIRPT